MPSPIRNGVRRLLRLPLRKRADIDADADAELHAFVAERVDYLRSHGMSDAEARAEAMRRLGPSFDDVAHQLHHSARTRERRMNTRELFDDLTQDLRYALRALRHDMRFAVFAIVIVGLGIGASVTVFSVANALLIRPLPFQDPDRLVWIANGTTGGLSGQTSQVSHALDLRAQNKSLSDVAGYFAFYGVGDRTLTGPMQSMRLSAVPVTANFFTVLGVHPMLGRNFSADETGSTSAKVVLMTHSLWVEHFNADASIVGKSITLNNEPVTVVGVLPASFDFGTVFAPGTHIDLFTPFPMDDQTDRQGNTLALIGRLKPGATVEGSGADVKLVAARLSAEFPRRNAFTPHVIAFRDHVSGAVESAVWVLALAVGVVMLIVCANLSNLLMVRATMRQKEMAVRVALGAGRQRLVRQMLTESVVLSSFGAVLGLALGYASTHTIARLNGVNLPLLDQVGIDINAVLVSLVLALVAGLAFGIVPALQVPSTSLHGVLKDSGRSSTGGKHGLWTRNALVVSEIALACVLLVGAGLLGRSFLKVLDVDMGFKPDMVASLRVDPSRDYMTSQERFVSYINDVMRRAAAVPGVKAVAIADGLPLGSNRTWSTRAKGKVYEKNQAPQSFIRVVSDGYINALGMRLIAGRDFTPQDAGSGEQVVLINQTLARTLWPGENAVGQSLSADHWRRVIGVVGDVRQLALEQQAGSELYLPIRQTGDFSSVQLVVRTTLAPSVFASSIRAALRPIAPDLPTNGFQTLQQVVDRSVSPRRFTTLLLTGFAAFALILALLGIYGVISYTVNQRTQEIGVRMALGASAAQLQGRILRETLLLAGAGMVIGTVASWALGRTLGSFLFGVSASDPLTFGAMLVVLTGVAAISGYVPARRASRIDPMAALRST